MLVLGAVRGLVGCVLGGRRRDGRLAAGAVGARFLCVLRVQFLLGLQPMRGIMAVRLAGLLPDLVGAMRDFCVT